MSQLAIIEAFAGLEDPRRRAEVFRKVSVVNNPIRPVQWCLETPILCCKTCSYVKNIRSEHDKICVLEAIAKTHSNELMQHQSNFLRKISQNQICTSPFHTSQSF